MAAKLSCLELNPKQTANASLIMLHGLGASGDDFASLPHELDLDPATQLRVVLPNAPTCPITINGGYIMPAWYDILGLEIVALEDAAGICASASLIAELIQQEIDRGIPSHRIVLGGFSQGGAMALHTGLRFPERLAGIIGLSTYLPLANQLAEECASANARTPIFLAHGTFDPVVYYTYATASEQKLTALQYAVEFRTYPMQHCVCPEEFADLARWLNRVLAL
jgi:phospholipase/carboxylesterase